MCDVWRNTPWTRALFAFAWKYGGQVSLHILISIQLKLNLLAVTGLEYITQCFTSLSLPHWQHTDAPLPNLRNTAFVFTVLDVVAATSLYWKLFAQSHAIRKVASQVASQLEPAMNPDEAELLPESPLIIQYCRVCCRDLNLINFARFAVTCFRLSRTWRPLYLSRISVNFNYIFLLYLNTRVCHPVRQTVGKSVRATTTGVWLDL